MIIPSKCTNFITQSVTTMNNMLLYGNIPINLCLSGCNLVMIQQYLYTCFSFLKTWSRCLVATQLSVSWIIWTSFTTSCISPSVKWDDNSYCTGQLWECESLMRLYGDKGCPKVWKRGSCILSAVSFAFS